MTSDLLYAQIGDLIRRRRKQLDITQEQLAPLLGISRASVANIETGRQKVLVHQLYAMAEALKLAPADLLPPSPRAVEASRSSKLPLPNDLSSQQKEQISRLLTTGGRGIRQRG